MYIYALIYFINNNSKSKISTIISKSWVKLIFCTCTAYCEMVIGVACHACFSLIWATATICWTRWANFTWVNIIPWFTISTFCSIVLTHQTVRNIAIFAFCTGIIFFKVIANLTTITVFYICTDLTVINFTTFTLSIWSKRVSIITTNTLCKSRIAF